MARDYDCRLFINDYWETRLRWIRSSSGQEDLETSDLALIQSAGLRLGISTLLEELGRALACKPSYVALGPIFETKSKAMAFDPQGFAKIGQWVQLSPYPIVAIGGLKLKHCKKALEQGADGIALISDITEADDPEMQVREWLKAMAR